MAVWAGAGRANHQFSLYPVTHREEETKHPGHHQLPLTSQVSLYPCETLEGCSKYHRCMATLWGFH